MLSKKQLFVCLSAQLGENEHKIIPVRFKNQDSSVIVLRIKGMLLSYHNLCVHMPRKLDGEDTSIFDAVNAQLRCSMHGIAYEATTGESLSEICRGQSLTTIRVLEEDNAIWINDKRVTAAE